MSHWISLTSERLYPPNKIAAMAKLLLASGVAEAELLKGTGLDVKSLKDTSCLTSIEQYERVCSNAIRLTQDPSFGLRSGAALHLLHYGVLGLLLQSCESGLEYFHFTAKYQLLVAPFLAVDWIETDADVVWVWPDEVTNHVPGALELFLREQQVVQQVGHVREVLGPQCHPKLACFAYPAPPHQHLYSEYLGCPCVFDCDRSELRYEKGLLMRQPVMANWAAAATLQAACDGLLAAMEAKLGFAGQVYGSLHRFNDPSTSMSAVATSLGMNVRTLHRRLAAEGTSFSVIAHQVKLSLAIQYLKNTDESVEQIASIAGFSDPANFRRAFIRWTSVSPAKFRRQKLD